MATDVVSTKRKMAPPKKSVSNGGEPSTTSAAANRPLKPLNVAAPLGAASSGSVPPRIMRRSRSAPPPSTTSRGVIEPMIEHHYRVDPDNDRVVLPGVIKYDNDWERDSHDFFNLIILVPVVVLNGMNWNWDMLLDPSNKKSFSSSWTGEWFDLFFQITVLYFVADLIWVALVPTCVKSPSTIIQHHIATLLYLIIPYRHPWLRWVMGACMSVEINTWFLIARRVFNKQGFPPWVIDLPPLFSIRVKLISIFFYLTWISIRCVLYPIILVVLARMWVEHSKSVGTKFNVLLITLPLHSVFCILNLKWTYDLLMSKMRYWRKGGKAKVDKGL